MSLTLSLSLFLFPYQKVSSALSLYSASAILQFSPATPLSVCLSVCLCPSPVSPFSLIDPSQHFCGISNAGMVSICTLVLAVPFSVWHGSKTETLAMHLSVCSGPEGRQFVMESASFHFTRLLPSPCRKQDPYGQSTD